MQQVIQYQTRDGQLFDDKIKATAHEAGLDQLEMINKFIDLDPGLLRAIPRNDCADDPALGGVHAARGVGEKRH